jgi:hypothetical protein
MAFMDLEVNTTNNTHHVATRREIHVGLDQFGQLVVTIDFGVIGTCGQHRVHLVTDIAEAQAVVSEEGVASSAECSTPDRCAVPRDRLP